MPRRTLSYVAKRLLQGALTIVSIAILNFLLLQALPGDVVDVLAGEADVSNLAYLEDLRTQYGLDQPVYVQLWNYLGNLATADLGYSFRYNEPVLDLVLGRLPATLLLMVSAIILAAIMGIVLGVTAARFANRLPDTLISVLSLLAYATPVFWIGLMLIVAFSIKLSWFPSGGYFSIGADLKGFSHTLDVVRHMFLPTITLALFYMALYTRIIRASMLEVLGLDYVRAARARGMSRRGVSYAHALPNAILPMITMIGIQVGHILGAAVIVETVFSWPGMGRLAVEAVFQRDFNTLLGVLLLSSGLVILTNLIVDLVYARLDPRIELG